MNYAPDTELQSMLRPAPPPRGQAAAALDDIVSRLSTVYLWATAGAYAFFAALLVMAPGVAPAAAAASSVQRVTALCAAVAAGAALLARLRVLRPTRRVAACALLGLTGLGGASVGLGWGIGAPAMGFAALHAALAMALGGTRVGALATAAALLLVWGLALAQLGGLPPAAPAGGALTLGVLVLTALVALGALAGYLAARHALGFMRAAEEREQRFRGLLSILADAYFEMDAGYRLTALSLERDGRTLPPDSPMIGAVPWEMQKVIIEPEQLDGLIADLDARQPFHDLPVAWQGRSGVRQFIVSGTPRFDQAGVFLGYWGVARDITRELTAQRALRRTEARYQDLFACIPTPLIVHRHGHVIDANPAALTLFGHADVAAMRGVPLLEAFEPGDSAERVRERIAMLENMGPGEALPVADYRMRTRRGRELVVRATGVAVETERGGAILSIFVDDTERQAAEDALRRSEALLSHLVASSPDLIALTEVESGRLAMINRTFERLLGWRAQEVVGRNSAELGIWEDPDDRDRLVRQVVALGRLQDLPVRLRHRSGRVLPMLMSLARFTMDRRMYVVINGRDMSEVEQQRLEREAILDNASLGIALTRDGVFQQVNPAFETMVGWPPGEIIGQSGAVVWPGEHAYEDIGRRVGLALARGEQVEVESEVVRRDGQAFMCRILARAVDPNHPSRGGTIWVVEDITERRRLDEALARARDHAEAANHAKSAFLANTSHELRTPLNGLLGLAQLARVPGLDEGRRAAYLDQIVDSARALAEIVSDILDLSKIEAGRLTLSAAAFDLAALLHGLQRSYASLANAGGLSLAVEVDPGLGPVTGDALRVRQILTNFLGNAIKFTAAGGVRLTARRLDADVVRLEVHDSGPGIDPQTQERLFQAFTQGDASTTRRHGGTGLGLSICRELAALMGGSVGVNSRPGEGSCFWAELPLPVAAADAVEVAAAVDADAALGAHVLLVDDNEVNMMVAVAQLEQAGVRVGQAVDGQQALDAVAAAEAAGDPYDLVVMDLQMPVLSGFEVTAALRLRYSPQELPIVAHTAAALVQERDAALAAGMNDFLSKPSDAGQLRAMVARWVRARQS